MKRVSIDPITRLEGHGRIDMFMTDEGTVDHAYLVIPELRGFEKFLEGRPVEELPLITQRICGVCPEAHHAAAAKATDAVYGLQIPQAAEIARRLQYNAFMASDHATHFYALGGPDFIVGPDAPAAERNLLGVVRKVGLELASKVIRMRKEGHEVAELLGGRRIHPVGMVPGGISQAVTRDVANRLAEIGEYMVAFALESQQIFADIVLGNRDYLEMVLSDTYVSKTNYLALVNEKNQPDPYDGMIRIVSPEGVEIAKYHPSEYLEHFSERVEPWSYLKLPYLKTLGWHGTDDAAAHAVIRTGPLGSLNASDGMQTPLAQEQYEKFFTTLGGKPVHNTLAFHWARLIEMLQSAELVLQYSKDERLLDPEVRVLPGKAVGEGIGCVEAPRGLLTHHYKTDENGMVQKVNLIVGTTYNYPAIQMSVQKAARGLVLAGMPLTEPLMNRIEMAFRAYDPCFGCATHALTGSGPLEVRAFGPDGRLFDAIRRDFEGNISHPGEGEVLR